MKNFKTYSEFLNESLNEMAGDLARGVVDDIRTGERKSLDPATEEELRAWALKHLHKKRVPSKKIKMYLSWNWDSLLKSARENEYGAGYSVHGPLPTSGPIFNKIKKGPDKEYLKDYKKGGNLYEEVINEEYDTEARKKMAEKGFALADGSFPIANLEDLKNAIQAYGRAKDQAKAAKFIVKRAKALGAEDLVPDTDDFQKSLDESI